MVLAIVHPASPALSDACPPHGTRPPSLGAPMSAHARARGSNLGQFRNGLASICSR
jgi:hypothetical protein